MRRRTYSFFLLLIVVAISAMSVVFWFDTGKDERSFRNIPRPFRVEESRNLSASARIRQALRDLQPQDTDMWAMHARSLQYVESRLTVDAFRRCSPKWIIRSLLEPGRLEIWNTGSTRVSENKLFNPRLYPSTIPRAKPLFTGTDLDPNSLNLGRDQLTGYYFIDFRMKGAAASKLSAFTSHNIGRYITITFDRVVVSSTKLLYVLQDGGQFQMSARAMQALGIKCVKL